MSSKQSLFILTLPTILIEFEGNVFVPPQDEDEDKDEDEDEDEDEEDDEDEDVYMKMLLMVLAVKELTLLLV